MSCELIGQLESVATTVEPGHTVSALPDDWADTEPLRLVIVSESAVEALGMTAVLGRFRDVRVMSQAREAPEALAVAAELGPDIVLVGLGANPDGGLRLLRELRGQLTETPLVAFSGMDTPALRRTAVDAGASAYVHRDADPEQLRAALRAACSALPAAAGASRAGTPTDGDAGSNAILTRRELEVLSLIAAGNSSREIARLLGIRLATVNAHRASMMKKLNVHKAVGLAQYWILHCQPAG